MFYMFYIFLDIVVFCAILNHEISYTRVRIRDPATIRKRLIAKNFCYFVRICYA